MLGFATKLIDYEINIMTDKEELEKDKKNLKIEQKIL